MEEIFAAVDRISSLVVLHLSEVEALSRTAAELRPWTKTSIERCLFTRLREPLWSFYERRYAKLDAQYVRKADVIGQIPDNVLFEALEIRPEFRGWLEPGILDRSCQSPSSSSTPHQMMT